MFKGRVAALLIVAGVVCLGLGLLPWIGTAADEPPRPPGQVEADFTGKVLAINTDATDKATAWTVLEQVQVRKVGSNTFLVGKGADDGREGNPYKGRTLWISANHIVQMVEFANLEELKKSYRGEQP
jgi:hypothetical protein